MGEILVQQLNRLLHVAVVLSASLCLASCGGGGGSSAPVAPPAPVPVPLTPPAISVQPQTQSVSAGTNATFSVTSPNATAYQWERAADGATYFAIAGATGATLVIPQTALIDSGTQYRVLVSNNLGSLTSSPASLTVRPNLRLLAGSLGGAGYLDGQGAAARFDFTRGSAVDALGNVFVPDSENQVIRRITPNGAVTTFAGTPGVRGRVDGPLASAQMGFPRSTAFDSAGVLWFVDQRTCYLRKISGGVVTSFARLVLAGGQCTLESLSFGPNSHDPAELAISPAGDIYVSDRLRNIILRVDTAGNVSLFAGNPMLPGEADGPRQLASFRSPRGLAFDGVGNLYVAESSNATIRRIDLSGDVTTIAGAAQQRAHLDGVGTAARLAMPVGLTLANSQTLAITDTASHTVRLLDLATLTLTTIAGNPLVAGTADGSGTAAGFNSPFGISSNGAGVLYVSDSINNTVRRVTLAGVVTTLAGQLMPTGFADGTGPNARFGGTVPLAADANGNVYLSDSHTIRKVTPSGVVTTIAGSPGQPGFVDGAGSVARFNQPAHLAVDDAGNVIVADSGNHAIRKVTPTGVVTTVAGGVLGSGYVNGPASTAQFDGPAAVALDTAGSIYVADEFNCVIRKITTNGVVGTLAGAGPANCASVDGAQPLASISYPRLLVATGVDEVIFVEVMATQLRRARGDGSIQVVAGNGAEGNTDGLGVQAYFTTIGAMARDGAGNIYVADARGHSVRLVRPNFAVSTLLRNPPANTVLGDPPSLRAPLGIAVLPNNALAISTEAAIVIE